MSWLSRLARTFSPRKLEDELDEEQRFHLEARADDLVAAGLDPDAARREARRLFGGALAHREASRDAKLLAGLEGLLADVRFGLRMLRRDGRITLAVLLSLGLAMGACTAAFSLLNALVLRPLPVRDPDRLIYLDYRADEPEGARNVSSFSYAAFTRLKDAARPQARLFGMSHQGRRPLVVGGGSGEREWVQAQWVSGEAFLELGIRPALGRLLGPEDDRLPSPQAIAVLSHDYWQRRFGGSPEALGRRLTFGEDAYEVVGVAEPGFRGAEPGIRTDVWIPMATRGEKVLSNGGWSWFRIFGRLEAGASAEGVRARLQPVFTDFRRERAAGFPKDAPSYWVEKYVHAPLRAHSAANGPSELRGEFQEPLVVVAGVAAFVLLIAGSNVTNLLLARGAARQREMALRVSIGAGRFRLVRQLLVESGLLAAFACALGTLVAAALAPLVVRLLTPAQDPAWLDLRPDPRVLGFLALLATAATVLFGLGPALRASGIAPAQALHQGDHRHSARVALLRPLLALQVGFSFLVLFTAGLLVASFHRLSGVDLGFSAQDVLIAHVETDVPADDPAAGARWASVVDAVRGLPGVDGVSHSAWELFSGSGWSSAVRIPGRAVDASEPYFLRVSEGFLGTMRIPLLEGRDFHARDGLAKDDRPAIVNQAFVRRYFPGESALGRSFLRLERGDVEIAQEIVGVVRDARYRSLREPAPPTVYLPHQPERAASLQVRTRGDLDALALQLPGRIRAADVAFRVNQAVPQATLVGDSALRERLLALLSGFFAVVALLLVAVGLFGVMSYSVVRRTREIGIRMALGARRSSVIRLVVGEVGLVVAMGVALGGVAALGVAPLLGALLFEARASDPLSLGLPLAGLTLASVLSVLPAARRAARVDPMTSLRSE